MTTMLNFVWLYTYTQISVQYQFNHRPFFSNIYYNRKLSKIVITEGWPSIAKCWTNCCHNSWVISYIYTGLWYIYTLKCSCSFSTNSFSEKILKITVKYSLNLRHLLSEPNYIKWRKSVAKKQVCNSKLWFSEEYKIARKYFRNRKRKYPFI
jgi:hypothetical protein